MTSQSTFGDLLRNMRTTAGRPHEPLGRLAAQSTHEPQRPDVDRHFFWYDGQPPRRT